VMCVCHPRAPHTAAGCPAASVAAVVQGCEMSGCTAAQCMPTLSYYVESCDQAGLTPCTMALSSCFIAAGGNPAAMCACR
jgi:hypothetical protein